jgi:hypothetical protein
MKKVIAVTIGLVSLPVGVGRGQDGDYSDHFGWEDTPASGSVVQGPSSVAEAKRQGRAYRIGQRGPSAVGGADLHVVSEGDTLWDISGHYFDDPWHWPQVWSWNPEITNPHWIYPLDQIRPGLELGEAGEGRVLVATTGRVKVKVDASNGPIQIGDLLVTSEREGFAMKSVPVELGGVRIHRPGTLIGKALEPLSHGTGEILVLLSMQ